MIAQKQTPKYLLAALLLVGTIIGGFGVASLFRMKADAASGETAFGRIVSFEVVKPTTGGGWSRYPVVEFTTKSGERVTTKARTSSDAHIGSTVQLLYQPNKPGRVDLPEETAYWIVPWGATGCGIMGVLLGILLWRRDGRPFVRASDQP